MRSSSAAAPPRDPVTYRRSPARARPRCIAWPFGAVPRRTMSAISSAPAVCPVSPPASGTGVLRASEAMPRRNPCNHRREPGSARVVGGSARERKAASGCAPIAARSLSPRARQRWPADTGECRSRRKCRPSRKRSRGDQDFGSRRRAKDGAVVTDTQPYPMGGDCRELAPDRFDERELASAAQRRGQPAVLAGGAEAKFIWETLAFPRKYEVRSRGFFALRELVPQPPSC